MKRIIAVLITIATVLTLPNTAYAADTVTTEYDVNNVTVIFNDNTVFSETERQKIVNQLIIGEAEEQTAKFNILCLFGHKYEIEYVTTITHKVNTYNPRCLRETFEIGVCKRCGESYTQRVAFEYITCCPED